MILSIDDRPAISVDDIYKVLDRLSIGRELKVKLLRKGEAMTLKPVVAEQPQRK